MPKRYTSIRDSCIKKGGSTRSCKTKAAKIYNATKKRGEPKLHRKQNR